MRVSTIRIARPLISRHYCTAAPAYGEFIAPNTKVDINEVSKPPKELSETPHVTWSSPDMPSREQERLIGHGIRFLRESTTSVAACHQELRRLRDNNCLNTELFNMFVNKVCKSQGPSKALKEVEDAERFGVKPNVVSYNIILTGYAKEEYEQAAGFLHYMAQRGVMPDTVSMNILLNAIKSEDYAETLQKTMDALAWMRKEFPTAEIDVDDLLPNTIAACLRAGRDDMAKNLVENAFSRGIKMTDRLLVAIMSTYSRQGKSYMVQVQRLVDNMHLSDIQPSPYIYSCLLAGYATWDMIPEVEQTRQKMLDSGLGLDEYAYNSIISVYARKGRVEEMEHYMRLMEQAGYPISKKFVTSIIIGYGKVRDLKMVWHWFELGVKRRLLDASFFNAMLSALLLIFGREPQIEYEVCRVVDTMKKHAIRPDAKTNDLLAKIQYSVQRERDRYKGAPVTISDKPWSMYTALAHSAFEKRRASIQKAEAADNQTAAQLIQPQVGALPQPSPSRSRSPSPHSQPGSPLTQDTNPHITADSKDTPVSSPAIESSSANSGTVAGPVVSEATAHSESTTDSSAPVSTQGASSEEPALFDESLIVTPRRLTRNSISYLADLPPPFANATNKHNRYKNQPQHFGPQHSYKVVNFHERRLYEHNKKEPSKVDFVGQKSKPKPKKEFYWI